MYSKSFSFPVTADAGIDIAAATEAHAFVSWLATMDTQKFTIRGVHIQSLDVWPNGRVGFIKFKADVVDKAEKFVPGIVFMRGGSVGVLTVLSCGGKRHALMVVQPRVPTGRFDFVEIPAGMLDESGCFATVGAAKELEQEAGIKIRTEDLTDLSAFAGHTHGHFPSPGGSDETIRLFLYEKEVTQDELSALEGKCTGVHEEGEQITLKIMDVDDLWRVADGKTCVAYLLYQKYLQKSGEVTRSTGAAD